MSLSPSPADAARTPHLRVRTQELADPGDLVSLVPAGRPAEDVMSWVRRGEGLVAWGRAASIATSGDERFADAESWWDALVAAADVEDEVALPGSGLVAFGSFSFRNSSDEGSALVVPEMVVGRRGGRAWLTTINRTSDRLPDVTPALAPTGVEARDGALTPAQWRSSVSDAIEMIRTGRIEKVVLARDEIHVADADIDPRWLLTRLAARYRDTWAFAVDGLVGATPELLVRSEKGLVTSRVLAGTIRRAGAGASSEEQDLALAASLARSSKDLEEHEYAVRSVEAALRPHCSSMNVPDAPFVLNLPNVLHLATDVSGALAGGASSLTLAASLHPSAAVCGTPTNEAALVIDELEHMDRGRYAGPVGWIDAAGDGEWGIALRSGQIDIENPCRIRLFAGCGIVAGSDPVSEVAESVAKLSPMREALRDD